MDLVLELTLIFIDSIFSLLVIILPKNLLKKESNYQNATRSGSELTRFFVIHLVKILILTTFKQQLITYKKLRAQFSRIDTA